VTRRTARAARAAAVAAAAGALSLGAVHPVFAHDVHPFGPYTIALGWLHEPAYVGMDNAVQVLVKQDDKAFTGITDKDLTVAVSLGNQKMDSMPLVPSADPDTGLGIPGEYEMHFIPTTPGNYTFHISGKVNGTPVDETVTASDKTFATVDNPTDVEFPNKVPTNSDLATLVNKQTPRIEAVQASANQDAGAKDDANHAMAVAIVALVVAAVVGLRTLGLRRQPKD
jgi:hypothetical protein